jgi:hypothetical protein
LRRSDAWSAIADVDTMPIKETIVAASQRKRLRWKPAATAAPTTIVTSGIEAGVAGFQICGDPHLRFDQAAPESGR